MTLNELKQQLQSMESFDELKQLYTRETRIGAKKLIQSRIKQLEQQKILQDKYVAAGMFERKYAGEIICGIDEVGRGPLAGPVVACACILEEGHYYPGLTDSKKLSAAKRQQFENELKQNCLDYSIGIATVEEIDEINIYQASRLAMRRAVEGLTVKPTVLLIDAMHLETGLIEENIIKGDEKSVSISAASILAKQYRDALMTAYDEQYPGYDFSSNAGYGTKKHLEGLKKHGISPIHRRTFEPIKSML